MARKKSQDSVGSVSGFPYSVLWEEFGELWESNGLVEFKVEKFEKLLADSAAAGHPMPERVSLAAISDLLGPLELASDKKQDLADTLYGLAASYLIPQVRKAVRQTPLQIEKRLGQLAKRATAFAHALEEFDIEVETVLGLLRPKVEDPAKPDSSLFHFKQLLTETRDLAKAATLMAEEMPRRAQVKSVDFLLKRLIKASLLAIESAGKGRVRVQQADAGGRNPRPKGASARVLFEYLQLVEPGMPDATKVRLILEFTGALRRAERMLARQLKANV